MIKVHLWPQARGIDDGQGGVRRVVEGMQESLPAYGVQLVNTPDEADLIATHIQIPTGWERRYAAKPFVAHCHGLYWSEFEWQLWAREANSLVLDAIKAADACTVPTEWVARAVRRHTARRPLVVPHGINLADWDHTTPKRGYVYWDKTRPDPVCDPDQMNEVAALLPNVQFVATFGAVAPNVRTTGKVPFAEAQELMQGASAYLCTARETFGISILQAWASGIPVVGWRWGGAAELVEEGKTGYLVRPFDYPALAAAIERAIAEQPIMSAACRAAAAEYTWFRAAEQYAGLYREVLARRRAQPRTTIIVPAYGLDRYLPDTLNSVLGQTDPNWECIVVDDASPDRCGIIADDFAAKDPRFKVIHNRRNMYLAGARNVAIDAARGRYVLPLDADDMLPPRAVELLANALDEDPTIHVAYGAVMFVGEDGRAPQIYGSQWAPGHSGWPIDFSWELQTRGLTVDDQGRTHEAPNCMPYASMYRIDAARNLGGYRERCRTQEDADFWTRLASYGYLPKRVCDADTLIYRVRDRSMSQSQPRGDHTVWFGWRRSDVRRAPAGSCARVTPPVPSLDPPGISVIIPVGPGHERLVQKAVDSLEAQGWRGWEAIVVNDTGAPLPAILPSWVTIVETGGRVGVAAARNLGAEHARGRLLLWLDADDWLQPDALETWFDTYVEQGAGEVCYYSDFFDAKGTDDVTVYRAPDWDPRRLLTHGMIGAVTSLTPKSAWLKAGGFDPALPGWEDWGFQLALAAAGICSRRIARPLWTYNKADGRRREQNMASFGASKAGIIARFGQFYAPDGLIMPRAQEVIDMACSSCRSSASGTVNGAQAQTLSQQAQLAAADGGGLVPLVYTGARDAAHTYRSQASGRVYRFWRSHWQYVDSRDVDWLMGLPGFQIMTPSAKPQLAASDAPILA